MANALAPRFARDEVVEAVRAFWAASPHGDILVKLGERRNASDDVVQAHQESFVRFGSTDADKRAALRAAEPEREVTQHRPAVAELPKLKDEDACIALRRILHPSHNDGMRHLGPSVLVEAGEHLSKTDPRVRQGKPGDFIVVVPAGCTRDNSLRAKETVRDYDRVGGVGLVAKGEPIIKGTWALKTHHLVVNNRTQFEEID
jgi:hypothetical protein